MNDKTDHSLNDSVLAPGSPAKPAAKSREASPFTRRGGIQKTSVKLKNPSCWFKRSLSAVKRTKQQSQRPQPKSVSPNNPCASAQ